jgi:Ser/Thr protein kinase RdoA (MazF antagonist)
VAVVTGLREWAPDPPGDNRPSLLRWPRWRLLLDDLAPASVLVVGEAEPGVERWLGSTSAQVRWVGGPRGLTRAADLVVVGADAADAFTDRHALRWLVRSCAVGGTAWLPWDRTPRRERALAAAGFLRRQWLASTAAPRRLRMTSGAGVALSRLGPSDRPPQWLTTLGSSVGWDADAGSWSLSIPGAYPSQKAVAVLRPGAAGDAAVVVKLAQDPRFDDRVQNEARALRGLADAAPAFTAARAPAVLGELGVGGVAAVVEGALLGAPFLEASTLRPTCRLAADAAAAVTELAAATSTVVAGADLATGLADLHSRFVADQRPSRDAARELERQVGVIAARRTVPAVVVHGDLGTWNLVVVDERVRILDWESATVDGPPLWDLAYLMRSYAVRSGRRRGLSRMRSITRHLVDGSPLTSAMATWVRAYRDVTGIDPELAEALFHTCWMHRAVKESARLAPGSTGHYGPLCALLVAQRRAPGVRQLLGT